MRVDGPSSEQQIDTIARLQSQARNHRSERAGSNRTAESPPTATSAPSPSSAEGDSEESTRGVIQLLRAGHFRGVADVRLRINFADELQGIQTANTAATLNDGVPALQGELNAAIDAFVEAGGLSEEEVSALRAAQTDFNDRIGELLAGDGESAPAVDDIFAELRTAFEDFLNSLIPPGEDNGETEVPVEDGVDTEAPASEVASSEVAPTEAAPAGTETESTTDDVFAGLRETLSGIFEQGVADLESSVAALGLPELSQPNGNGGAFDKFLAIYRDLYQLGDETEPSAPDVGLDAST